MTVPTYPSTPYLRQLTPVNGWRPELIPDRDGQPYAVVAVRVGSRFTDAVAIEGEDRCVAVRTHTPRDDGLILPSGPVWQRHGDCTAVLAELLALPDPDGTTR